MRVLGIIAEYNPFHNGHLYQLEKSKDMTEADFVVAVMSGNFTQRGEAALFSKWTRAEAAVRCGADLVIELPFVFACNNAEYFAKGAVEILNRMGCITHLSFGSEYGEPEPLKEIAEFLSCETQEFKNTLKANLDMGLSYPKARANAVSCCLNTQAADIMSGPNNILAIEYLKQLNILKSDIKPVTVKRMSANYHSLELKGTVASASALRSSLISGNETVESLLSFIPETGRSLFKNITQNTDFQKRVELADHLLHKIISAKVLTSDSSSLREIFSASEGLENKLKEAVRKSEDLTELKALMKSKRYTLTRINRLLIHLLTNLTEESFNNILKEEGYYARILAFNQNGAELLKHMKKSENTNIPYITNINRELHNLPECLNLINYDLIASDLYNLLQNKNIYDHSDQRHSPFRGF